MRRAGILAVAFVTLFALACGGGGEATLTPTIAAEATPTEPTGGTLMQFTAVEYEYDPPEIVLTVGQPYQVQLLNRGTHPFKLRLNRWNIQLFAGAGADSEVSKVFIPDTPGDFDCYDELNVGRYGMRCNVKVVP